VPQLSANIRKLKEARETRKAAIGEFKYRLYQAFDVDRQHWLRYVDVIAHIDCLIGLARASASLGSPVCRPKFRAGSIGMVDFRELRHPSLAVKRDFIPNDITLGASNRVVLLTGQKSCSSVVQTLFLVQARTWGRIKFSQ
jgi:DNA mismatch repair protein MSH6